MSFSKYFSMVCLLIGLSVFYSPASIAWEGTNLDSGGFFSIESFPDKAKGEGRVEYMDYVSGENRSGYIKLSSDGSGTIKDDKTGKTFKVYMQ